MSKSFTSRTYFLTAVVSFVLPCLVVIFNIFPAFGISLSLIIFALFSYKHVKKNVDTKIFFAFSLVFSSFLFIRSEPVVSFLNFWTALFFGVLMLTSPGKRSRGFTGYLFLPISFFFKALLTKSQYHFELGKSKEKLRKINANGRAFGVALSFLVLAVILPLLASTNPLFKNLVIKSLNIFYLENLIKFLGLTVIIQWLVRIFFFFLLLFILPKVLTLIGKKTDYRLPSAFKQRPFPLLVPKIVTSVVLILFFVTQFQLYFSNQQTLSEINVSYSQRAREVFGQLSAVAVVAFILIYNSETKKQLSNKLNWLLGIEGIFLTLMAYKSVFEYIGAHGLTYKRLYGIVFATLVTGVFVLYQKYTTDNFAKRVIFFLASMLLVVNIANFDFLIYHFNRPSVSHETDYRYLSTLSADSLSYDKQFAILEEATFNESFTGTYQNENPLILLHQIESLQKKYSDFDLREFNLLEYIQYREIKNIKTSQLRKYYENRSFQKMEALKIKIK